MHYLKNRLREASTWAGLGVACAVGSALYHFLMLVSVACGAIAVMMPDYSPSKNGGKPDENQ